MRVDLDVGNSYVPGCDSQGLGSAISPVLEHLCIQSI